ncbi:deoxyribose-phosphate aldolase [Treponema parvum]|uniref:Deoxyribose-phosphate aldolase n=2 Tax=Treponema parvum TaxID=138851 RepID=A0A975IET5_9SPIR|nr:deoxyribose-phosphate aldolase [Treponema parvum]QTQ14233.1 deoxyribose-phosphate aldolase [Treponema parvum]
MTEKEIAGLIDHTLLSAFAKRSDIEALCREAISFGFACVCVNPIHVSYAAELLKGSSVGICTVIGFPLGALPSKVKAFEAEDAINKGACEVDMVIDIGAAKEGRFDDVKKDIRTVVDIARKNGKALKREVRVKVIIETCYLTDDEIVFCCSAAKEAGADFVKTSTGFGTPKDSGGHDLPNGASADHVRLMRKTVGDSMGVKASGGIRDAEKALEMIRAGASRIGTSSGVKILQELKSLN